MENRPTTGRPWFRLASQVRMEPPAPTPPLPPQRRPLIRIASFLPAVRAPDTTALQAPPPSAAASAAPPPAPPSATNTAVLPPVVPQQQQPPKPVATSPLLPGSPRLQAVTPRTRTPPLQSPRIINPYNSTPPPSPKISQQQQQTSPLTVAPSPPRTPPLSQMSPHPEPETKPAVVLMRDGNGPAGEGGGAPYPYNNNNNGSSKTRVGAFQGQARGPTPPPSPSPPHYKVEKHGGVPTTAAARKKKSSTGEADSVGMRMVTLAGENTGAYMDLGGGRLGSWKHEGQGRGYLLRHQSKDPLTVQVPGEHIATSGSYNSKPDDETTEEKATAAAASASKTRAGRPVATLVNSNVQSVNNSIMLNSSCNHQSPGVHVTLSSGIHHPSPPLLHKNKGLVRTHDTPGTQKG